MDPRLDHSRMDPRMDPRLDPRMEPRMDPRMDARSMDPRLEQRMDGRMMQPSADNRSFEFGFTTAGGRREVRTLEDLFHGYGVRIATLAKMTEMGFTVSTLVNMTEAELDDVIQTISDILQMELLVGERYGIKSAVRAEKKHLEEELERQRLELLTKSERKRKLDEVTSALVTKEGVFPILAHTLKKQKIFSRVSPTSSMTFVGEGSGDASPGQHRDSRLSRVLQAGPLVAIFSVRPTDFSRSPLPSAPLFIPSYVWFPLLSKTSSVSQCLGTNFGITSSLTLGLAKDDPRLLASASAWM
ncbi:hypothetical protein AXG93_2584s1330 [Marchantia polymorpha subsp. ruderalis]|uniref:Floricaula/leafy-like transcription factor n=1 Tax=Marchantia polymorpha subsp. ruderalis TaxID=1480154 RepID=A0A176VGK5_MARPO|nr:hypothetical protein AXG93_2584s1330 [Marchantia polymorpha subsp. ruderalis]